VKRRRSKLWRLLLLLPLLLAAAAWGWLEYRQTGYFSPGSVALPEPVASFELGTRLELNDVLLTKDRLLTCAKDSTIRAFELDGRKLWSSPCDLGLQWAHLSAFPDGPVCVHAGGNIACFGPNGELLWEREEAGAALPDGWEGGQESAGLVFVSEYGGYIALASNGKTLWGKPEEGNNRIQSVAAPDSDGLLRVMVGKGYQGMELLTFTPTGELLMSTLQDSTELVNYGWPVSTCRADDGSLFIYTRSMWACRIHQGAGAKLICIEPDGGVSWDVGYRHHTENEIYCERRTPDWGVDSVYVVHEGRLTKLRMTDGEVTASSTENCGRVVMFCYSGDRQLFAVATHVGMSQTIGFHTPGRRRMQLIQFDSDLQPLRIYRLPTRGVQRVWTSPQGLYIRRGNRLQEYVFPDDD
jgi:hypothetical protein